MIGHKSKRDIQSECENGECPAIQWIAEWMESNDPISCKMEDEIIGFDPYNEAIFDLKDVPCPSVQRIVSVLKAVDQCYNHSTLPMAAVSANRIAQIEDIYGHQQWADDFGHIHSVHRDAVDALCRAFKREIGCQGQGDCPLLHRHLRRHENEYFGAPMPFTKRSTTIEQSHSVDSEDERKEDMDSDSADSECPSICSLDFVVDDDDEIDDIEEVVKQQKLDQIHCFLVHSGYFRNITGTTTGRPQKDGSDPMEAQKGWFEGIESVIEQNDDEILYQFMTHKMDTFRWQTAQYVHFDMSYPQKKWILFFFKFSIF